MAGMLNHGNRNTAEKVNANEFFTSIKKLLIYGKNYKLQGLLMIIFAIGGTSFTILGPKIMGKATTILFEGLMDKIRGKGEIDFSAITKILVITAALYGLSWILSVIQGFIMASISNKITFSLRRDISAKIHKLPIAYFDKQSKGDILSRVTNDVDTIQNSFNQSATQIITSITTLIGVVIMMLSINIWLALITFILFPLSMAFLGILMKKSQKFFIMQQNKLGAVNGNIEESFSGHIVVKAFNQKEGAIEKFNEENNQLCDSGWKAQFLSGIMMPLTQFIGNIGYVFVALIGGIFASRGIIQVGEIQAFFQYIRSFTQPIRQIAQVVNLLQSQSAAAKRVFDFLEAPCEDFDGKTELTECKGKVEFSHVSFGYNPDNIIINDFNAKIMPGQKCAIVGPTGAGKSTIIKLLMAFYHPNRGDIYIDDINTKNMNIDNLRSQFGMVLQDTWLFTGTIMENVRYGRIDATDEEVIEACKAAHIHNFIMQQADGYDMVISQDSNNISMGQKQLLTIARAILANRPILLLDEATSSVDTRTEIRIQKAMDNLLKSRTSFVIAHRLSTIIDADVILVMKDGDICEIGNHNELLSKNGFYANLYRSQFADDIKEIA